MCACGGDAKTGYRSACSAIWRNREQITRAPDVRRCWHMMCQVHTNLKLLKCCSWHHRHYKRTSLLLLSEGLPTLKHPLSSASCFYCFIYQALAKDLCEARNLLQRENINVAIDVGGCIPCTTTTPTAGSCLNVALVLKILFWLRTRVQWHRTFVNTLICLGNYFHANTQYNAILELLKLRQF